VLVATFLSVAAEPCPTNFKFPSLDITVVPEADSNKNWPTDDDWKNSYSAPTGALLAKTIEAVNVPPTIWYFPALAKEDEIGEVVCVIIGLPAWNNPWPDAVIFVAVISPLALILPCPVDDAVILPAKNKFPKLALTNTVSVAEVYDNKFLSLDWYFAADIFWLALMLPDAVILVTGALLISRDPDIVIS